MKLLNRILFHKTGKHIKVSLYKKCYALLMSFVFFSFYILSASLNIPAAFGAESDDADTQVTSLSDGAVVNNLTGAVDQEGNAVTIKISCVDEFGDAIADRYTNMKMPEFNSVLTLDDPANAPVKDVTQNNGLIGFLFPTRYNYVQTTINNVIVKAIRKTVPSLNIASASDATLSDASESDASVSNATLSDALLNGASAYSYTTDGETWTQMADGTEVKFEYTSGEKTEYTYNDADIKITAALEKSNAVPSDSKLIVTPITKESDQNSFDRLSEIVDEKMSTDTSLKMNQYRLYDIHFVSNGEEIEPKEGSVKVTAEFKNEVLKENNASDVKVAPVLHIDNNENVEVISNPESKVEENTVKSVSFTTDSFSTFVFGTSDSSEGVSISVTVKNTDGTKNTSSVSLSNLYLNVTESDTDYHITEKIEAFTNGVSTINIQNLYSTDWTQVPFTSDKTETVSLFSSTSSLAENSTLAQINGTSGVTQLENGSLINNKYKVSFQNDGQTINGGGTYNIELIRQPDYEAVNFDLDGLLGNAYGFGVVTNEFHQNNDLETNFAAGKFIMDSFHTMGIDTVGSDQMTNEGGLYYFGDIDQKNSVKTDGKVIFQFRSGGTPQGVILNTKLNSSDYTWTANDGKAINFISQDIDIASIINSVGTRAEEYTTNANLIAENNGSYSVDIGGETGTSYITSISNISEITGSSLSIHKNNSQNIIINLNYS